MSATRTSFKTQTRPALLNVLVDLRVNGENTAKGLNAPAPDLSVLKRDGLVRVVGKVSTGKAGRPAHIFALTDKGHKRAKRALAKTAA